MMQALRFLFSTAGILAPRRFIAAVIVLYLVGAATYALTLADVVDRAGPWPFAVAQAVLLRIWFALHVRRLRDAGRSSAIVTIAAVLYALQIVVLVAIGAFLFSGAIGGVARPSASGAIGLILFAEIVAILIGHPDVDVSGLMAAMLVALAAVPPLLAACVSLYAAAAAQRGARPA